MIKTSSCAWVECDGENCDVDKGWHDEGPLHFESVEAAVEYVLGEDGLGWTRRPDGRLLCRRCSESADCDFTGHQHTEWRPKRDAGVEWRMCEHCGGGLEERFVEMGGNLMNDYVGVAGWAIVIALVIPRLVARCFERADLWLERRDATPRMCEHCGGGLERHEMRSTVHGQPEVPDA